MYNIVGVVIVYVCVSMSVVCAIRVKPLTAAGGRPPSRQTKPGSFAPTNQGLFGTWENIEKWRQEGAPSVSSVAQTLHFARALKACRERRIADFKKVIICMYIYIYISAIVGKYIHVITHTTLNRFQEFVLNI